MSNQEQTSTPASSFSAGASFPAGASVAPKTFQREKHIQFFKQSLVMLPAPYTSMDTHRMTLGMFALGGLELLGVLEDVVSEANRKDWIEWIYSQQRIAPSSKDTALLPELDDAIYGFGGPFSGLPFQSHSDDSRPKLGCECDAHTNLSDSSHLAMTYTALLMLILLGDDLSRVSKESILRSLRKLQQPDGCFISSVTDPQSDLRFLYCAAAISHMLNDWSGFDRQLAMQFIQKCQTHEHGFARCPQNEAHGGTTYCGVATLGLLGGEALFDQKTLTRNVQDGEDQEGLSRGGFVDKEGTRRWCLGRQTTGFQGRINKPTDTCYSFWIGASLDIMGSMELVNYEFNRGYLMTTQNERIGGFSKEVKDNIPDILHSYMGIAGLALMGEPGIRPLDPLLNISKRMEQRLYTQTIFWKSSG